MYHGVPVTAILQAYSICQIQPDLGYSDDNNYLKNSFAEAEHVNMFEGLEKQTVIAALADSVFAIEVFEGLEKQTVIAADGSDLTELVEKAVEWLIEHSF